LALTGCDCQVRTAAFDSSNGGFEEANDEGSGSHYRDIAGVFVVIEFPVF
jgi:hypothetical protein